MCIHHRLKSEFIYLIKTKAEFVMNQNRSSIKLIPFNKLIGCSSKRRSVEGGGPASFIEEITSSEEEEEKRAQLPMILLRECEQETFWEIRKNLFLSFSPLTGSSFPHFLCHRTRRRRRHSKGNKYFSSYVQ